MILKTLDNKLRFLLEWFVAAMNLKSIFALVMGGILIIFVIAAGYLAWVYFTETTFNFQRVGFSLREMEIWDALHQWHELEWFSGDADKLWNKEKPRLFAIWPHGVWPQGLFVGLGVHGGVLPENILFASHSILMSLPIVRELAELVGCFSATKERILGALKEGHSVGILPEGALGRVNCTADRELLDMRRTGQIKAAIEGGVEIVPVQIGGQSRAIRQIHFKWVQDITRKYLGIPLGSLQLGPWPEKITVHFGDPISVVDRSDEEIQGDVKVQLSKLILESRKQHPHTEVIISEDAEVLDAPILRRTITARSAEDIGE